MGRFLAQKAIDSSVGDAWIRRLGWELRRVPVLLRNLGNPSVPDSARGVRPDHILALRRGMRWERATFALHFAALRQFLRWGSNPVAEQASLWRLPSGASSHRRWLTAAQFARLLKFARGRERLLVALEGLNGLRRVEILRLRRQDVLLDEDCLRVLGKGRYGGKWRKIPMHSTVRGLIAPYLAGPGSEPRLFPFGPSAADQLLRRAAHRAAAVGFPERVSHHDLRRTFGRIAHESGMDLIQLKNLMGHSSVEMTVHYIGLDADRMRRGLELIVLPATS